MLERIEGDGTLYSYASATFFMIYALLGLGYRPDSPVISQRLFDCEQSFFRDLNACRTNGSFTGCFRDRTGVGLKKQAVEPDYTGRITACRRRNRMSRSMGRSC
ncbi:hypothetical protein J2TS6_45080 [Paenibacillus albilobatus]|uniref:Uncharacterized protein n=1 Tax=Paenibacillus albilobatus TaxID=2716884 RepID=A0A919XMG0_9BACL|nr:hypothetical protein J2TS6_45080 [Paenibacillus albilobatus]